jgi:hypothetical protein
MGYVEVHTVDGRWRKIEDTQRDPEEDVRSSAHT